LSEAPLLGWTFVWKLEARVGIELEALTSGSPLPKSRAQRGISRAMEFGWKLEARVRIELTYKGFADLSLTTWVPRPHKANRSP
jgi:hypothetical protein